ncbi:cubilin [Anabrus simplex]|uniref:cubilin n=1 Tax=Anabrus simplex TaxID=316456 RepID=UPI0035A3B228
MPAHLTQVRQAVDLLGDSEGGRLSNLQRTITKLNNAIFGKSGLGPRVSQLEQGVGNSSSSGEVVAGLRRMIIALRNKLKANECSSNPCRNGGTCEDSYDSFICRCPPNWEGTLCDTDVNECARFAGTDLGCQNGATCINKPGTYECSCATGWFGIHCTQTSNACTSSASRDLCGHGLCITQPNSRLGFSCICEQGWTKDPVTQACTQDVDECASNHPSCSRDPPVACINVPGSFYCGGCPQGYTGNGYYCADIDECQVNNGGCSMNPTVQCINTQGSRKCGLCPPGYQGDGITCTYRGVCQINNGGCHHLARCVENQAIGPSYVQCICPAGYAGSGVGETGCIAGTAVLPSNSACLSNPCVHGTCTPSGSSYVCSCVIGYTGPNCAIAVDPCANNPCKNGGTCVPHQGTFHCRCPSNSTGATCEEQQMSCGGRLNSEEGSLSFPPSSTSQTYVPNLSCAWVILTNASMVLNVTFTSFHLEEAPDCNYDWLQIHDGRSSGDQLINRFCGTKLPNNGSIISTHNSLYLWFRSDHSINKDGFSLTWKSINPVCGGHVEVSHGSISSPGYPGKYPKNRDCFWTLRAPLTRRIQFNFITVKLENHPNCSYDFLEIKDGLSNHSPVLEKLCTTSTPAPIMSSGPVVGIRFHSDDQGNDGGFLISYNTVPGIAGCGGILSGTSGTISCPMENGVYRHNLDCEWIIQVPAGSRIRITFDTFELESSRDCRFDMLEVREGKEPTSPLVGRYCGNVPPRPYLSRSNYLTIIFQSDWSGSGNGFQIQYEEICGGIYGDPSGVITSPNYPENYPTNKQCIYEIAQPLGKAITLTFYDFQMESHYRCNYDYLEIRDGHDSTAPLMGTYCDHIPPTVVSTYNFLWLKFQTDFSRQRRGFYANYTTLDVSCGGILKNQTGTVESPHYPNLYSHNELCRWIIVADVGQVIQLTWTNFELESSYNCIFDYLEIYDNDTMANGSSLVGRYCGLQKPPDITSMNNILTLVFSTDSSRRSSGFQATFTQVDASQVCGGNYFSAVGTLRSPGYPNQYPHSKDCVWILKVPYGQQLKLNITDFHLEYHPNCRWDYLEIRNGGSATAPLIGKYCGTDIPPEIQAISNKLYLHFKSDYSRTYKGFEISWDGTSRGCGGTLTSPQGSIKSPNYPEPYERHSECFWKISTSRGSTIQAVFVDIQLESSMNCLYDYVALYDGMDASAKLLGKFCQISNAIAVQSTSNHMFIKFRSDMNNEGTGFHINYATMCTTDIIGFQGVIESPNFPSMYPSHLDCKWNIKVPKGNKVNLTFSHFELEREPCLFDYLQVSEAYHGEAIYQPLTEKLCGSRLPPPVHSTSDKVQVSMVTDFSVGHSGFRLEWLLDGCGGRLTRPEGEFTSPGYPGRYKDEVECHWSITVPLHLSIELTIHDLVMEGRMDCRFDSLTIYGGPDTSMVLVPPLCHSLTEPLVVTSSGNNMVVVFTSDVSYSGRGFRASYVGVPSRCGGLFTAPAGRIQSRNYPKNYDPHDDCLWLIKVAPNHVVQLTFIDFDLEMHANCSFDYVKLFDGNTTESPVIATLCGSRMPNITTYRSTSNTLLVRMKADGSRSLKGFAANYTTACGAKIITDDYGIIDLHPSVNVNEENLNCSWVIIAAQPDERITFTITHMDISPSMENSHESCEFAFVEVRDGDDKDAPLKGRYCGSRAPPQISSVGSALFVHMVSMYGAHYGHFSASYAVYSAGCGADLTSEHGSFASPDYPSTYPLNSECVWTITSAPGNRVMVNFRSFALEESTSCNKDYLEIREGDGAGRMIGIYCTELPSNITASQTLWIKFHSDGDETAAGFIADYSLVHGNDLSGPSGEIASPLYPRSYIQEGDFSWRVTVQFGYAISITFTDFFIEKYMDFCDLYLVIYDGYDETGVEIFKGCGYLIPDPVTSSSNVVYIMMHTMAMYHGSYFKLNWLQVERAQAPHNLYPNRPPVPGCGGRIYLSDWDNGTANNSYLLQSPGYPNGYARMLDCEWIIETPSTSHAQMIVQNMDLESYGHCFSDYVTVYEDWLSCNGGIRVGDRGRVWTGECDGEGGGGCRHDRSEVDSRWMKKRRGRGSMGRSGDGSGSDEGGRYDGRGRWRLLGSARVTDMNSGKGMRMVAPCLDEFRRSRDHFMEPAVDGCAVGDQGCRGFGMEEEGQNLRRKLTSEVVPEPQCIVDGVTSLADFMANKQVEESGVHILNKTGVKHREVGRRQPTRCLPVELCLGRLSCSREERHPAKKIVVMRRVGNTENWRQLKTMCLSNASNEGPIDASGLMKVLFHSDYSYNRTGFSSRIYSVCGGTINAPSGVIEVHNMTNKFSDRSRYTIKCQWNVTVRSGRTISVTFDRFQVPEDLSGTCSNSYLMLRNGHSQDSPILGNGKYCSNNIPEIPHTTSNYLFISYYGFSNSEGFKMRFSEVAVTCGGQYTLTSRNNRMIISSPNYPNIPIPHSECTWVIMAPGGERIQVDFNDTFNFNTSPDGECTLEYVELRDGGTEMSPLIDRYCYSAPSTQTTTENVLFLRFFTDTDDPHTGFQATISLARCGGTVRGFDGEISSPGYPGEYPSNIECIWRIVGYRNHLLELQFKDLHLPTSPLGCSNVDNVTITEVLPYNRTENVLQTICGTDPQPNIQLGSNEALITFKTGPKSPYPFTHKGFYMNYNSSYDFCGGELSTPEGQIQSPGYPNGLPHHRYCEWTITVPRGRRITVTILDLDMDFRAGSNLMFFNHDFSYFITSLKSNSSIRQIESSSNKMKVYYYARTSAGHRGFQATYHSNQPEVCGGDILQDSGTISLSASRDNIRPLYCEWRRTNTNPGNQTFAIIISNAIIGYSISSPCFYRGTKLYAYVDENSFLLTEVCRNITQGPVIILSPFLSTTFVGSQGVRGGPLNFTAQYQILPCGGVLTGPEQIISSPGFPNNYPPNMHCAWSVSFPSGQAISVHFLTMNLETNCGHDYVKIHSGASPTAPRIGSYCGTTVPQDFVAQSNTLWIEFHSDKEVQSQGFKLHLTPVTEGCGGIMHTNTGMASSPNFPNKYPNNAECEWDIRVENGYFIQLQFVERFKLEDSSGCVNDFVEVLDYREGNYVSLGKFCGANTPPFFNSTSTQIKVLFRSNGDITADGFKIQWNVHCGGIIENVTSGIITSPGFPHTYENGLYCNYTVIVPEKPIRASFDFFHVEDAYQGCRYDNVTIYILDYYSHSFHKIGEYCGINAPPEFSAMGAFSLVFVTDSWGRFDGFVLRFEAITCGGDLHDPGRIELPKLYTPFFYSSINCTWTITAPANLVVLARFTELVANRYRSCYSDNSVNVYDGPYAVDVKRLGRFCGNITHSPPVVRSSGNAMVIQYLTYTYIRFHHFEADILFTYGESVGCGGRINATSSAQTIRSPDVDRDNRYEANLDCHWLIRAQDGQVLNVRMTSFQLEPCNNTNTNSSNYCGCDFLEVYDGPSQYSALIDRYCGSEIPSTIISSTNHLWLRFVSDGERNGRGFVAEVTSVNSICGPAYLNVTTALKELTSPNYPANAPVNLRCRWLLEDSNNWYLDRIVVHVEDVDIQGGGLECTNAKLELADAGVADIIGEGLGENFVYSGRSTHIHSIRYSSMSPVSSVTFCGHVVPHNFYSEVGKVYVSLVTSSVPSKGFKLQYSVGGCNRNYTSVQGRIKLTRLPASCDILIETTPNRTISLYFSENVLEFCETSGIEVKDGASSDSPVLQRLCGYNTFNPIFSTGPYLRINIWNTLHDSYNYFSLDMTYTTTDQGRGCGGELFNYGGIFTSPLYPSNNRNSSVCRWHVTVPANLQAALHFSVFDLGSSTTCSSDFVEILEVDLMTKTESVRSRYCGGDNPAVFISPNNVFVVRYTMSVHNEGSGWVAHFMGKPPGSQLYEEMTAFDGNSDYY